MPDNHKKKNSTKMSVYSAMNLSANNNHRKKITFSRLENETSLTRKALTDRLKILNADIRQLEKKLSAFPEGELFCYPNTKGRYSRWYLKLNSSKTWIPKKDRQLAQKLACKKLLTAELNDSMDEKALIVQYLKSLPQLHANTSYTDAVLTNPLYCELLTDEFKPLSQELIEWMQEPYEPNLHYPDQLTHTGISGKKLRSKSEVMIERALFTNRIPYRYESPVTFGDKTIYPDFLIRHPKTGNTFIWEHFGMMDNPQYVNNVLWKLEMYLSNGYIPQINLITTYESFQNPIRIELIENLVRIFFLS